MLKQYLILRFYLKWIYNKYKSIFNNPLNGILLKKHISSFLPYNPNILEAGAHIGIDTFEMSKIWPEGNIFAFEPVPDIFDTLKKRTKGINNIYCFNIALSSENGKSKMFVSSGTSNASSSLLMPKDHLKIHPKVNFESEIEVDIMTIDTWAKRNNVKNIDFMWLDMQGFEFNVLNSSPEILKSVKVIYTEVNLIENYEGNCKYKEFRDFLTKHGFYVEFEDIPNEDSGNVLFIKK